MLLMDAPTSVTVAAALDTTVGDLTVPGRIRTTGFCVINLAHWNIYSLITCIIVRAVTDTMVQSVADSDQWNPHTHTHTQQ